MMQKDSKIFVAGHNGTAGTAICEMLKNKGFENILTADKNQLNLSNQEAVEEFFSTHKPEFVFLCAVLPCGAANVAQRADFLYENLMIECNVIHSAYKFGVKKLIFFGSGYMYPMDASNPLKEEYLFQGNLEHGAYSFGTAKIAGAVLCESYNMQYNTNFICLALNNLYGTRANFDFGKSRVLPALLRKFHLASLLEKGDEKAVCNDLSVASLNEAKEILNKFGVSEKSVEIWGTGEVKREFLHCDDLADGAIFIMQNIDFKDLIKNQKDPRNTHINIGTNKAYSIKEVANLVKEITGFGGKLVFNASKPDSRMDRIMDCSKIHSLGWSHKIELEKGIKMMYQWYISQYGGGGGNPSKNREMLQ